MTGHGTRFFPLFLYGSAWAVLLNGSAFGLAATEAAAAAQPEQGHVAQAMPSTTPADKGELEEVVVTARKREESLAKVPVSITAFTAEALSAYNVQSFNDYATKTPGLSFSYGGGPPGVADARTIAIRGIGGQSVFGTTSAVGFYLDDTPVPASIDPRILDVDHIEVLKGPQGTLFGESSLSGNVRVITKKPDLDKDNFGFMMQAGATWHGGSPDGGVSAVGNLVLVPSELAIRVVGFYNHDAGYMTRTYPTDPTSPGATDSFLSVPRSSVGDQGAVTSYGGSLSMLWRVADNFDATLHMMAQESSDYGLPAAFAPLPSFTPDYTLNRAANVQPGATDRWAMPSLALTYRGSGWQLVNSSSYFYRHTTDTEDSTYGTLQALASYYGVTTLPPQPYLWIGNHGLEEITNETRLSFDPIHDISGTVGVFYSRAHNEFDIPPTYATGLVAATGNTWPNDNLWDEYNPGTEEDVSAFGELYYKFLDKLTLTLGAREYWLRQTSDVNAYGFLNGGTTPSNPQSNHENGLNPKVGLSYQINDQTMVYASASKGFRAGGAQFDATFCALPGLPTEDITHLKSDTLWSYEGGAKLQLSDPRMLITAAVYHIDWKNVQQQVALPCGYFFDINGGSATINGGEMEISGKVLPDLQVRLGFNYDATSLTDPGALSLVGIKAGSRILGVPAWEITAGGVYSREVTKEVTGFLSADYSFTGDSNSLLNGGSGLMATRPSYGLVNLRVGADWGKSELSINVRNLTNAKPNLGDLGYNGYPQFNAADIVIPQVATLQPRTATLQYKWNF